MAVRPLSPETHESTYRQAMELLGLSSLSTEERLRALEGMTGDELMKLPPFLSFVPMVDGDVCPVQPSFESLAGGLPPVLHRGWCGHLLIGDCAFDVSLFGVRPVVQ